MTTWWVDAPSWPVQPVTDNELTSDEVLDVLDLITPEVYAAALASLADTTVPTEIAEVPLMAEDLDPLGIRIAERLTTRQRVNEKAAAAANREWGVIEYVRFRAASEALADAVQIVAEECQR